VASYPIISVIVCLQYVVSTAGRRSDIEFTPRRLQQFKIKPGEEILYRITRKKEARMEPGFSVEGSVKADDQGLITLKVTKVNPWTKTVILTKKAN